MYKSLALMAITLLLSACTANQIGRTVGGIVGGHVGRNISDNSLGKAIGTAVGAIGGSHAGGKIADSLVEKYYAYTTPATLEAVETHLDGDGTSWRTSEAYGEVVVLNTDTVNKRLCRDFVQTITENNRTQKVHGMACQNADGSWEFQSRTQ